MKISDNTNKLSFKEKLDKKIISYIKSIWLGKVNYPQVEEWLSNFNNPDDEVSEIEKVNMLYLLSKFSYLGEKEIKILLESLYNDLFKQPKINEIRSDNKNTMNIALISDEFQKILDKTFFVSVGTAANSGGHLLYPFNKVNTDVDEKHCKTQDAIMTVVEQFEYEHVILTNENIDCYIFLDDIIGTGDQVLSKLRKHIRLLREKKTDLVIKYFSMLATSKGLKTVRDSNLFDEVKTVFELDDSFISLEEGSRYYNSSLKEVSITIAKQVALSYGTKHKLYSPVLGHGECQLLLGFNYNTPDNSLPIFWSDKNQWKPIFKRN
jgi:hypothetical protein